MIWILILFVALSLFIIIYFKANNYQFEMNNFTFFEGDLGSGKTSTLSSEGKKEWKRRKIYNCLIANKFVNFILTAIVWFLPLVHLAPLVISILDKKLWRCKLKKRGTTIYSTYPYRVRFWFWQKWTYAKVVDRRLFNWLLKVNEDCICLLDELGYFYPPTENEKGYITRTDEREIFGLTWLRHAVSPFVLSASQSIDEVNIAYRRKVNHIYRLSGNRRVFLFLSKVSAIEIQRSEDSGSIITTFSDTTREFQKNWHYYIYPRNNFESRYAKYLYELEGEELKKVAHDYDYLLQKMGLKAGDDWNGLYYKIL